MTGGLRGTPTLPLTGELLLVIRKAEQVPRFHCTCGTFISPKLHSCSVSEHSYQKLDGGKSLGEQECSVSEYSYQKQDGGKSLGEQECSVSEYSYQKQDGGKSLGEQECLSPKLALDIAIVDSSCYQLCCSQLKVGGTLGCATPLTTSEEINFLFCDHIQPCSAAFTSITSS